MSSYFTEPAAVISPLLFRLLNDGAQDESARERCRRQGIEDPVRLSDLSAELFDLWQRRSIQLMPVGVSETSSTVPPEQEGAI